MIKHCSCGKKMEVPDFDCAEVVECSECVGKKNVVEHPSYYNVGKVEAWDIIKTILTPEEFEGWLMGSALKYLIRYKHKGYPYQDLCKAQNYLGKLIKQIKDNK